MPVQLRKELGFPEKKKCLRDIHFPGENSEVALARKALIFEELLHLQLTVARRAATSRPEGNKSRPWSDVLIERLQKNLPFELTPDQLTSLEDVKNDLAFGRWKFRRA